MKLSDRVDALDGADRGVAEEIAFAVGWRICNGNWYAPEQVNSARRAKKALITHDPLYDLPPFSASLDAAITLFDTIPETIPSCPRKCVAQALRMKGL